MTRNVVGCTEVDLERRKTPAELVCEMFAHWRRHFPALIDSSDHQIKRLGRDLMRPNKELFKELFEVWARYRDGTITRRGLVRSMKSIRGEINSLLLRGVYSGNPGLRGMCAELHGKRDWLWTFVDQQGIEPTNNASERSSRHAVIWRKLSFGTQSWQSIDARGVKSGHPTRSSTRDC